MLPVGWRPVSLPTEPPSPDLTRLIERVQAAYGHACFACGRNNPIGLGLRLVSHRDHQVTAEFDPRPDYRGVPELLHGGIAATALDEVMVWAGIVEEGVMSVTGTLDLRYRRPLGVDRPVLARGRVESRSGRRLRLAGELLVEGAVAVEGRGVYLVSAEVSDLVPSGE